MGNMADVLARHEAEREALATQTAERVAAGHPCCTRYREMTFAPMRIGIEQEVVLTESSPLFDFPFGRSRFLAFELPPLEEGDALEIKAVELISGPTAKPIFRPKLILLSETFEPIEAQPALDFDDHFTAWDFEGHAARLPIDGGRSGARFLIVAADPAYAGREYLRRAHTTVIPAGGTYVSTGSPDQRFPYGYEGRSFVKLERRTR
jgi:hypothetical protein